MNNIYSSLILAAALYNRNSKLMSLFCLEIKTPIDGIQMAKMSICSEQNILIKLLNIKNEYAKEQLFKRKWKQKQNNILEINVLITIKMFDIITGKIES
jgi:hypothetical protein